VVQELRRLGLVDWDSQHVKIRDWKALAKLGDFSDHYLQLRPAAKDNPLLGSKVPERVLLPGH
jgi:hypothetical protein